MEPLFFVLAIMGCDDGGAQCATARVLPARYATAAQCRAALPRALADNTDLEFPTVQADCRAKGAQMAAVVSKAKRRS